jgi:hypothetical protein
VCWGPVVGVCWGRAVGPLEPNIAQNEPLETIWEPFGHHSPEQLKMSLLGSSGSHFATRAQNSSKWVSGGHLGAILPPEPRTAQNKSLEAIWEPFCYRSHEQLKMSLWRPSGSHFATLKVTFQKACVLLM